MLNTSYQEINRSPLNNSTSKQLYTFSKAHRFIENTEQHCQALYSLPATLSKRSAGIGYGKKVNLTHESITPGPSSYDIKPELTITLEKKKGWTMAVGREESNKYDGIFLGLIQKTPGPGSYTQRNTITNVGYTMRKRTESYRSKEKRPGPGEYNLPDAINSNGKYKISQYRDSGAIILSPMTAKSGRFTPRGDLTPGPGSYKHGGDIDPIGMYYCSKYADSKASTFTKAKRETTKIRNISPGPGMYKLQTEFGYYENKNTNKTIR